MYSTVKGIQYVVSKGAYIEIEKGKTSERKQIKVCHETKVKMQAKEAIFLSCSSSTQPSLAVEKCSENL
jgi:hypothetical protein